MIIKRIKHYLFLRREIRNGVYKNHGNYHSIKNKTICSTFMVTYGNITDFLLFQNILYRKGRNILEFYQFLTKAI